MAAVQNVQFINVPLNLLERGNSRAIREFLQGNVTAIELLPNHLKADRKHRQIRRFLCAIITKTPEHRPRVILQISQNTTNYSIGSSTRTLPQTPSQLRRKPIEGFSWNRLYDETFSPNLDISSSITSKSNLLKSC